jgi:hypothetical protein
MKILNVFIPETPAFQKAVALLDKLPISIKKVLRIPTSPESTISNTDPNG